MNKILETISELRVIPVITIEDAENALPLGTALISGNLPLIEITFRTSSAVDAIRNLSNSSLDILIGAGTILTPEQAQLAVQAGAKFIVSPGFSKVVVNWCIKNGVIVIPGVATSTEIMMALDYGLDVVKFFPSEPLGGLSVLKAISGPFADIKFIPTGGITPKNLNDYLRHQSVIACGGSWLANRHIINTGNFQQITKLALDAYEISRNLD